MNQLSTDELVRIARRVMADSGFEAEFPAEKFEAMPLPNADVADMRQTMWSSIDDASSRDLDQVEYAERLADGRIRVLVGIADVDAYVRQNSPIDTHAAKNTVSVYAGSQTFPLLPAELSFGLTSLLNNADRLGMVTEMCVDANGTVSDSRVYPAYLHNYAKLSYEAVGAWLDENAAIPEGIARVDGMKAQIRLQLEAAGRLQALREKNGALEFESIESAPIIENGNITGIRAIETNSARRIIENFMIAANVTIAEFLENAGSISLRRVVKTPQRWDKIVELARGFGTTLPGAPDTAALSAFLKARRAADPDHFADLSLAMVKLIGPGEYVAQIKKDEVEGHFGLAVRDYAHSTAPNRRFADIVTQRLIKSVLDKRPATYSGDELIAIATHCNERNQAARKVERQMRKVIAASVLAGHIGQEYDAIVTGVKPDIGTFARILHPPADGMVVRGEQGLDVGEKVRVKLLSTDPHRGFIDFGRVGN